MPAQSRSRHGVPSLEDLLPPTRPPAPPPPEPPAAPGPDAATVEEQAAYLRAIAWPAAMYGSLAGAMGGIKNLKVYKAVIDDFVAEVGAVGAVERMTAEQLLLAHNMTGQLSIKGMGATAPDAAKVYLGAAARLMGEFRAHASALTALRAPAPPAAAPLAPPPPPPSPAPAAPSIVPQAPVARSEVGSNRVKGYYGAALAEVP